MSRERSRLIVALGCGGLRGFAHLGAIRALLDAGLPIDGLCGASAGALFGALYAVDPTFETAREALLVTPVEMLTFYRDRLRLAPSNPLGGRIAARLGERRIESLPIPLSILTLDLESGQEILLRDGNLRRALEASIAIPVVAKPVAVDGRFLIDGGYGQRGPAAGARQMNADVVVHVDLRLPKPAPPPLRWGARRALNWLRGGYRRTAAARHLALSAATFVLGGSDHVPPDADVIVSPTLGTAARGTHLSAQIAYRRGHEAMSRAAPQIRALLQAL